MTPSSGAAVTYAYNNFSRPTQAASGGHTLSFAYDQLSRNTSVTGPLGAVSYQYDIAGRRTRMTWPDSVYVQYDYDIADALTAIRENGATSGPGVLASYAYDDHGRRTSVTRGNGVVTTYDFDAAGRLEELTQDLASTGNDVAFNFVHNIAGQAISQDRTASNSAYVFAASPSVGNYTNNGRNQIASLNAVNFTYDGRGNLTGTGSATYAYDIYNRLTGAGAATLAYDPAGRLYQTVGGGVTTRFQYDGVDMIAEYNAAGTMLRRYVHGPGIDEPIVWYEGSGTTDRRWLVQDRLGSVIAVTDGAGAPLSINAYDEYGVPSSSNAGRFQYTGQMWIAEAGLYHYKARAYAPSLGRFLQSDPILYVGGMNLYGYVGNDPLNRSDPSGLQEEEEPEPGVPCPSPPASCGTITVTGVEDWVKSWRSAMDARTAGHLADAFKFLDNINWDRFCAQHSCDGPGHDYTTTNEVCPSALSPEQQAEALSRFAYPGQDPSQPVPTNTPSLNLVSDPVWFGIPGGLVTTTPSNGGRSLRNVTTPFHVFSGTIDRAIFTSGGRTFVTTHGTGTSLGIHVPLLVSVSGGYLDAINQIHGQEIFDAVDGAMADYLAGSVPGC